MDCLVYDVLTCTILKDLTQKQFQDHDIQKDVVSRALQKKRKGFYYVANQRDYQHKNCQHFYRFRTNGRGLNKKVTQVLWRTWSYIMGCMHHQRNSIIHRWLLCWINSEILPVISRQHIKFWLLHHPRDTTRNVFCCVQQDTQRLKTHGGPHHLCFSQACRKRVKFCIIKSYEMCVHSVAFGWKLSDHSRVWQESV